MLGNEAEFLLGSLGLEDLTSKYDYKQLVATASQINPQRLESVAGTFKNFRGWASYGASLIIDRVYGLDYIADIKSTTERIGFCFITNPNQVVGEVENAQTYSLLWKSLGVTKVAILLVVYPDAEGFVLYDKDKSQDNMLGVIMDVVKSNLDVISAEVHLEV
jgi:hypothetical protein